MTYKAEAVLNKLRQRQALSRLNNPKRRAMILNDLNRSTLDDVGPLGGDQVLAVLSEMNDLGQRQEQVIRDSFPKVTVY